MSNLGNKQIMAQNIRFYMEQKGKNRTEICNDLGIKYTTFSDWINGNTYPRIDKIELLANYFGVTKADLVEAHNNSIKSTKSEEIENLNNKIASQEQALNEIVSLFANMLNDIGHLSDDNWIDYVPVIRDDPVLEIEEIANRMVTAWGIFVKKYKDQPIILKQASDYMHTLYDELDLDS